MTIIDQSAASKVKVLDAALAAPGTCIVCGSPGGDGRKFVDIDMNIDFYGAVYFCSHCMLEVVTGLGYIGPERFEQLQAANEELMQDQLEYHNKEKLVDEFLGNIFSLGAVYMSSVDLLAGSVVSNVGSEEEQSGNDGESEPDPFTVESNSITGSDDIPGAASSINTGNLSL